MIWNYEKAGVDREKIRDSHATIEKLIKETYDFQKGKLCNVIKGFGHYASLIDIGEGKALALHCDGCGTKVLIAQLMNKFDTIGIDCVAMCVNDLICIGAEPTTLIDYLALEKPDEAMLYEIMKGLVNAAKKINLNIVGGETAIMPDVIKGAVPGRGFDLAAFCLGVIKTDSIIMGDKLSPNDIIIGLESSGIHSNGFSLARKILLDKAKYSLTNEIPEIGRSLGEELLEPTEIYVPAVLSSIQNAEIHAVAHITGGAFSKLKRFESHANVGFHLQNIPEPPQIFKLIQDIGKITDDEMYKTFNMGIGLCMMTNKTNADEIISSCDKLGLKTYIIGNVTNETGVRLTIKDRTISL
ncbi:phosphoribosylformylglycinamidine cyclo-ligase [[Eubacterium] cellulosolvens]